MPEQARQLLPLLAEQEYIVHAKLWEGEDFDYDLDIFRRFSPGQTNLADCHLSVLNLSSAWRNEAWLQVRKPTAELAGRVIMSRTVYRRGVSGFWPACYQEYGSQALFVGTIEEHRSFVSEVGPIYRLPTPDVLALGRAIAGSRLFIGNQSCAYAIAEGLKHPAIQEVQIGIENCIFERDNAVFVRGQSDLERITMFP